MMIGMGDANSDAIAQCLLLQQEDPELSCPVGTGGTGAPVGQNPSGWGSVKIGSTTLSLQTLVVAGVAAIVLMGAMNR